MSTVLRDGMVGLAGGLLGALAMNVYARTMGDTAGHGMQPAQSLGGPAEDAAAETGAMVYRGVTGQEPTRSERLKLGTGAHYAFSALAGFAYGVLADRVPAITKGYGTAYGSLIWAIADEGITPALGLSRDPADVPAGTHLYSLTGHTLYGVTLECVRQLARPRQSLA